MRRRPPPDYIATPPHQVGSVETWDAPVVAGQSYTPLFRLSHVYTFGIAIPRWRDTSGVGG